MSLPPYPSFEEMGIRLRANVKLDAEYGLTNHECCKAIYENVDNHEVSMRMADIIVQQGGKQALHCNFETLLTKTPISTNGTARFKFLILVQKYF